jgi:hypothetical protein
MFSKMAKREIQRAIFSAPSTTKAKLWTSLTTALKSVNLILGRWKSECKDLEQEAHTSPWERGMSWIILNCDIPNLFEAIYPGCDFTEQIMKHYGLSSSAGSTKTPSVLDRSCLRILSDSLQISKTT